MPTTIKLPPIGKSPSATVHRWRKQEGDLINKGDILLQLDTEEGFIDVESAVNGRLQQILLPAGKTAAVDTPLAIIAPATGAPMPASPQPQPEMQHNASECITPGERCTVTPILMPQAGQSMEEGVLVKWFVRPGDMIKKGDVIFDIETDKATVSVEATDAGRLARIVLAEGGVSKVLVPVAYLADSDADVDAYLAAQGGSLQPAAQTQVAPSSAAPAVAPSAAAKSDTGRVKASPAARKLATERGVELTDIGLGSGPAGRILSTDVPPAPQERRPPLAAAAREGEAPAGPPHREGEAPAEPARKRMSQMRKAIARNLLFSKQNIPHFYIKTTIDAGPLYSFYQGEKAKYPCSINDVIALACAKLIVEFPQFRSRLDKDEIVELPSANVGIAVGLDEGLIVPVLVAADRMTLPQLGAEVKRIAAAARAGRIEGMGQGVFTITNLGMFGVEEFQAIINPPEAAILAVGTLREEVIVSSGTFRAGKVMTLTLSVDHRIIDGVLAAKFLARLKEILEYPQQLT